jgi:hypothetical protein
MILSLYFLMELFPVCISEFLAAFLSPHSAFGFLQGIYVTLHHIWLQAQQFAIDG